MVTFYPEFEASCSTHVEVTFLLDMSNSMAGAAATDAKKVTMGLIFIYLFNNNIIILFILPSNIIHNIGYIHNI